MPNGNLYSYLTEHEEPDPNLLSRTAICIARGLEYMHTSGFIHRDLKSPNIFFSKDMNAVIADFGFSRIMPPDGSPEQQFLTKEIGSIGWMAPEMMNNKTQYYTFAVDVYSFGILLWEMATRKQPFSGLTLLQAVYKVSNLSERPPLPEKLPSNMIKLIQKCWSQDFRARPSISMVNRLLEKGETYFPGTNVKQFKEWIELTKPEHHELMKELITKKKEIEKSSGTIKAEKSTTQ